MANTEVSTEVLGPPGAPAVGDGGPAGSGQPEAGEVVDRGQGPEVIFDAETACRSFEVMEAELDALDDSEVITLRVDVQRVSAIALTIGLRDSEPERREKFERLAQAGYYDISTLDRLPVLAEGAWHVRRQQQRLLFSASGASLSEEDVAAAYELRARMMLVLGHWLGDRRDVATELKQLREGSGHQDLANDLQTLGEIYVRDDVRPIIVQDTKHYRATDPAEALRFAKIIMLSLGVGKEDEVKRLTALVQRAATLLVRTYETHRNRGQFLFQGVEDVAATYPSVYAAARNPRRKRSVDGAPGGDAGEGRPDDLPVVGV